jgi:hypothetical protein
MIRYCRVRMIGRGTLAYEDESNVPVDFVSNAVSPIPGGFIMKAIVALAALFLGVANAHSAVIGIPDPTLCSATVDSFALALCPAGDEDGFAVFEVEVLDTFGSPVVGYPPEQVFAAFPTVISGVNTCDITYLDPAQQSVADMGYIIVQADDPTDALGITHITLNPPAGGHAPTWSSTVWINVGGSPEPIDSFVHPSGVRGCDLNGDFLVNLCDFGLFANDYGLMPGYPDWPRAHARSDFNADNVVDLFDFAMLVYHYCHYCVPPPQVQPDPGSFGIYFDMAGTQETHTIGAGVPFDMYVVAKGITRGISAMEFSIQTDPAIVIISVNTISPLIGGPTDCASANCRAYFPDTCAAMGTTEALVKVTAFMTSPATDATVHLAAHSDACRNAWSPPPAKTPWGPVVVYCPVASELECDMAVPLPNRAVINPVSTPVGDRIGQAGVALRHKSYPNPFNPTTSIRFEIRSPANVEIEVWDLMGRKVRTLMEQTPYEPGTYQVPWNGTDDEGRPVASGVYLYQIKAGSEIGVGRMVLLK